jgi:hypothetical protein
MISPFFPRPISYFGNCAEGDQFFSGCEFVVLTEVGLGGRGQEWLGKLFVALHSVGEFVAAVASLATVICGPDRSGSRAGEVAAVNEFDREQFAVANAGDVRVGDVDHMMVDCAGNSVEPERGGLV